MSPEKIGIFTAALFAGKNLKRLGILLAVAAFVGHGGGWMLAKIALLVYAISVIKTAADPAFGRAALDEAAYVRGERRTLPAAAGQSATSLKGKYLDMQRRARTALGEVGRKLDTMKDPFAKEQFGSLRPQVEAMVQRIEALCSTAQEMSQSSLDEHAVATEVAELEMKAQDAADEQVRRHYLDAAEQKRKILENADWMKQNAARLEAELVSLTGTLERLQSDVGRVAAAALAGGDEAESRRETTDISQQLSSLVTTVDELEKLREEDRRGRSRARV
ncbi:MAG: hypothetical protein HY303_02025 [Candidatus Wallbacteria bacterium]|nr:hypothetical protein [Candidatus Wallbacteria bacterium]